MQRDGADGALGTEPGITDLWVQGTRAWVAELWVQGQPKAAGLQGEPELRSALDMTFLEIVQGSVQIKHPRPQSQLMQHTGTWT